MDFSSYPWMAGSFNIGDPSTSYLDPALMGQQPNIYAPASNPYTSAPPLSGAVPQSAWAALLSNPQLWSGLAGLGKQQQPQIPYMRPPEPPSAPGRQYMSQFMATPFYTVQRGFNGGRR